MYDVMLKKILRQIKNSKVIEKIVEIVQQILAKGAKFLPPPSSKHFGHVVNLVVLLASYTITSLLIYPHFSFPVFLKEAFALGCAYCAIFLWFVGQIQNQVPIRIIVGVTACISPVFFMNNAFSVGFMCVILLIIFEFIIFEYIRGCDLFSSQMPVYVICEKSSDTDYIQNIFIENKVLKLIALSSAGDLLRFSSIRSLEALDSWLRKIKCLAFFPTPARLVYFSAAPNENHVKQLIELSVKFSIPAFAVKINHVMENGKMTHVPGYVSLHNLFPQTVDKSQLGTLFRSKRIWVCFDGHEYVFDLIQALSSVQSIDLIVICRSEYVAVMLKQRLAFMYPEKIFNIKIIDFENFDAQDTKPDILFYDMPISSNYAEESNQKEAVIDNVLKTQKIIRFAQRNRLTDVFIFSSIKAFNANTWIGATQRLGELFAQFASSQRHKMFTRFHVIRLPDNSFSQTEIFGEISSAVRNNGYVCIKDTEIPVLQDESDVFPLLLKAISLSMKNENLISAVLTISAKNQTPLEEIVRQACLREGLRPDNDVHIVYSSDPRPMDLESFPNISETLEKTSVPNIFATDFVNTGSEYFREIWSIDQINRMSTRELVSAVMQSLNDKMKNQKKM